MNVSRLFGPLVRISQGIGAALGAWRPRQAQAPGRGTGQDPAAITVPMQLAVTPAPAPVAPGAIASDAIAPEPLAPAAPAAVKMRSIEEIRADLARLRQNAKERHAELRVQQQALFAPTDLMDIAAPLPEPASAPEREARKDPEAAFAATAFVDFSQVKSRHER